MNRTAAVLCCVLCSAAHAKDAVTLADLKALSEQKAFQELLEKAEGLPAAERTAAWRGLVATAAAGVITSGKKVKAPFTEASQAEALADRFTFLDDDAAFKAAKDQAVVKGLRDCMAEGSEGPCWDVFAKLEKTLKGPAALEAAKAFVSFGAVKYRPMVLFANGLTQKDGPGCADPALLDAVLAAFDLPPDSDGAKAAVRVTFETCWAALGPKRKEWLIGAGDNRFANLCKPLRSKKALSELQGELCKDAEQ